VSADSTDLLTIVYHDCDIRVVFSVLFTPDLRCENRPANRPADRETGLEMPCCPPSDLLWVQITQSYPNRLRFSSSESLSSLSRLGWGLERRGTGSLSSSVDCCYSNQLRWNSWNSKEPIVCKRQKERENERKNREGTRFFFNFFWKKELPPKK
jgi:hypothetical protein